MIDWDKIVESRVVDTFRDVCYKWWSMDVQFYDEKGRCKSKDIDLQNPFCNLMRSKTNGTKHCIEIIKSIARNSINP